MFIELIDLLRCTRPHEDTWLVAAFHEMEERTVVEAVLSCPVCGARFPVRKGIVYFDVAPGTMPHSSDAGGNPGDDAVRIAAYLNLVEPGIVLLGGAWARAAATIEQLGCRAIALNSPEAGENDLVSHVRSDGIVPLARGCLDGIALDSATASAAGLERGALALKTGARMVAPATVGVPDGLAELARDDDWWVAAREGAATGAPVQIARGSRGKAER